MTRKSARRPGKSRKSKAPFQQAQLLSNQKPVAGELRPQGAQRTAELAEGNQTQRYGTSTDIEDCRLADAALRTSEHTARSIVDSIPGLVVRMTAAGEVEAVNRQLLEYFGKSPEDIRNWTTSGIVHPEDLARATEVVGHSFATGDPYEMEIRIRRFDGVFRWFQARGRSVRDAEGRVLHWYALHTNIDDRKKAEDALRASEFNARGAGPSTRSARHLLASQRVPEIHPFQQGVECRT